MIETTCQHVLFMNENGIRCAWCDFLADPHKHTAPSLFQDQLDRKRETIWKFHEEHI